KLYWREDPKALRRPGATVARAAEKDGGSAEGYAPLITKCYPSETLQKLDALKKAWGNANDGSPAAELCWVALVSILRAASADATRLEMTFLGQINGWGDLQSAVREGLVRSCTQHVAPYSGRTAEVLKDPLLEPITAELAEVCARLDGEKDKHGGKKPYHAMI